MNHLPQDLYATKLRLDRGYPLRTPEPSKKLVEPYPLEGFQIGDVGYVDEYGEFNLLFNIRFHLPEVPRKRGFPVYEPILFNSPESNGREGLPRSKLQMNGVEWNHDDSSPLVHRFTATSSEGAILVLPSGATLHELREHDTLEAFQKFAIKYALRWCQRADRQSLYLITGVYKAKSWTLGAFNKGRLGGTISVERQDDGTYDWKYAFEVDFRSGPGNNSYENQTIVIKGFKMTMRQPPGIQPLAVIERVSGPPSFIPQWFAILLAYLARLFAISAPWLPHIATVEHDPLRSSQPWHPSDLITRYLLDKTDAEVAIIHDNDWISMLETGELRQSDLMQEETLGKVLARKYDCHSEHGTAYLNQLKDSGETRCERESSQNVSETEDIRIVITHIRAEDVAVGLARIPIGFYVQVDAGSAPSQRTKNKAVEVYDSIIQWDDQIELPSDLSAIIRLTVYASFEFSPMLGGGQSLQVQEISVGELLGRTEPIMFSSMEGEPLSPCSSLLIAVQRWHCNRRTLTSPQFDGGCQESSELARVTDLGHVALLHYYNGREKANLIDAIRHFEVALALCSDEEPHRAAALCNLATARFVAYQSLGTSLDFDTSTSRYREALKLRPDDHPDRPATLLYLCQALLYHYGITGDDASKGELLKHVEELMDTCPERTHGRRAAGLVLQTCERLTLRETDDLVQLDKLISGLVVAAQELPETYFDRHIRFNNLSLALLRRFQLRRDANDLSRAITWLEKTVQIAPDSYLDKASYLSNLSNALLARFQRQHAVISPGQAEDVSTLHSSPPRVDIAA